jgi:lipopolysaccharide biosynthesis glycosyltransferase
LLKNRKFRSDDQDALNILLNEKFTELNWKYNVTTPFFSDENFYFENWNKKSDYIGSRKNPTIVHFTGPWKPWDLFCIHPYTIKYDKFLKWANKEWFYDLSLKEKIYIAFHRIVFCLFPKYKTRICISNFIHKFL